MWSVEWSKFAYYRISYAYDKVSSHYSLSYTILTTLSTFKVLSWTNVIKPVIVCVTGTKSLIYNVFIFHCENSSQTSTIDLVSVIGWDG